MGRASRNTTAASQQREAVSVSAQRQENFKRLEQEKLNVLYLQSDEEVREVAEDIKRLSPSYIGLDFETASKNGKFGVNNGSLRLIQIGMDEPERDITPTQIVVDCFRASPRPLLGILRNPQIEKQIHNMFFEQEWSQVQLGARIQNVYDTCIAFRVIQENLHKMSEAEREEKLPGWKRHDNRLFTLLKIYLDAEMPKASQASDWGREKLLPEQIRYAAMDAAVMPLITEQVKRIADHVGCAQAVADKLALEDKNINERVRRKKREESDDSVRIERALSRAASEEELEKIWQSRSQMTVFSDSMAKIRAAYRKRKSDLSNRKR